MFSKQKRNAKRKHNERLGSPTPHMELGKDAGRMGESFLEGRHKVSRRVNTIIVSLKQK